MSILNCIGGCSVLHLFHPALREAQMVERSETGGGLQLPETLTVPMLEHYQFILSLTLMRIRRDETSGGHNSQTACYNQ